MSYTPTTWTNGDTITAEKLNKMEQGIAGAGGIFIVNEVSGALDKTFNEIDAALAANCICIIPEVILDGSDVVVRSQVWIKGCGNDEGYYYINTSKRDDAYYTTSPTGYPQAGVA